VKHYPVACSLTIYFAFLASLQAATAQTPKAALQRRVPKISAAGASRTFRFAGNCGLPDPSRFTSGFGCG
jgi:hypothetical protein